MVVSLPAASVERTLTLCAPSARLDANWLLAVEHGPNGPPSTEQTVVPGWGSAAENGKSTSRVVMVAPSPGPPVKASDGTVRSRVKVDDVADAVFPTSSLTATV